MKHLPFMTRMALLCGLGLGALPLAALGHRRELSHAPGHAGHSLPAGWRDRRQRAGDRAAPGQGAGPAGGHREPRGRRHGDRRQLCIQGCARRLHAAVSSGSTFTVNPAIRPNLPYDPVKSFEPIGIAGRVALILLANSEVPVQTVKQFVDYVKASPGKYSYGSFGTGTTAQFAGETMLHARA
jgi:hypothetical protein